MENNIYLKAVDMNGNEIGEIFLTNKRRTKITEEYNLIFGESFVLLFLKQIEMSKKKRSHFNR